ncbi:MULTISPECIES: TonB-dependent hemoglobin/transferrin/lactoferrin family receptor [unclassified Agarivorans]|uniref:TonB-dependent hemoglobin/transferrin/lactoferrin family receptor n=1 Tax=unclassified Agarivorans TaxID=2636026 RepID=UPI003D7CD410
MKPSRLSMIVLSAIVAGFVHAESDIAPLETIVVVANKYEEDLSKTAGSVAVINNDDMRKAGATELYDVLNQEPGISVTGGAGRPQNIAIRGMVGNRVAIVKDGIATSDGFGADDLNDSAGRNSFDVATLKQIQVVKGASSTSYGSGAIGGVVILKSYSPEDYLGDEDFYTDIATTYSGISHKYRVASNLAFRVGDTSSLISGAYWTGEETRNYQQDLYQRDLEGVSFEYSVHHDVSDQLLLKAKAEIYREQMNTREGTASVQADGAWDIVDYTEQDTTTTYLAWLGAEYQASKAWMDDLETKLYYRVSEFDEDTNRLMDRNNNGIRELRRELDQREFNDQLLGWSIDLNKELYSGSLSHVLVYGAVAETAYHDRPTHDARSDWNGSTSTASTPFAPARSYSLGMYLQDSISLNAWTSMIGLRFDAHQLTADDSSAIQFDGLRDNRSSELSPSFSLAYQFTPELNSYISYKHGYRAPEYDKTYGYISHEFVPITPFVVLPNFELKAETSDSFELGSKFDNGVLRVYAAVFYNQFENFISVVDAGFNASSGLFEKRYENLSGVNTYGAELSTLYALNQAWSLSGAVGWVNGKNDEGEYVRAITPLEGNLSLSFEQGIFDAYSRINWADAMDRTPSCSNAFGLVSQCAETTAWYSLDLGLGIALSQDLSLNLNVINLLDREYTRYQDVAGVGVSQTKYSTQPGRYFTVNARYVF